MPAMPSRSSARAADTRPDLVEPSEAPDQPGEGLSSESPPARTSGPRPRLVVKGARARRGRPSVARPEAGQPPRASGAGLLGAASDYPIQISKVQAPPLRDETLARDRLLEWLSVKIHRRAVLLIAEAGYGKTTLLADFSRRTRVRVLWFRLDRGDRDWVGFLAYLVAGLRVHLPDFGVATSALLRETATSAPTLDAVLDTFLRELGGLPNDATTLVFDDFHLVDDAADIREILRELLTRAPERMSFVFASRREPPIKLARLRALGEVAELGTDDLRFDPDETERLFRETYDLPLEPGVLAELNRRTEGWAASLQLVRSALNDRNAAQVRAFISSLSGAEGHLYDYLAEEVIGDLRPELQQFLMRTSLLNTVDLILGGVAAETAEMETRTLIEEGERHGLFSTRAPNSRHVVRAHPLVRDFLQLRLMRSIGPAGIREVHHSIAIAAEGLNWRVSAQHYIAAEREADARRVLDASIQSILGTGAYAAAHELLLTLAPGGLPGVSGLVLQSRMAQQGAAVEEGLRLAEAAHAQERNSSPALLTLVSARILAGDVPGALAASKLLEVAGQEQSTMIARAFQRTAEASVSGSAQNALRELEALAQSLRGRGDNHFLGVTLLNLSIVRGAVGEPEAALEAADEAITMLASTSAGVELVSARLSRANALAYLGRIDDFRTEVKATIAAASSGRGLELAMEVGQTEALVGLPEVGWSLMDRPSSEISPDTDTGEQAILARCLLFVRVGDVERASHDLAQLRHGVPRMAMAFEARRRLLEGLVLALQRDPMAIERIGSGADLATEQGMHLWSRYGRLLLALAQSEGDPSRSVVAMAHHSPVVLSMLAEMVLTRLSDLTPEARAQIEQEASSRPWRWREVTRRAVEAGGPVERRSAAKLLETIGEREDIQRLRDVSRSLRDRTIATLGQTLARRLANQVVVRDLGRVRVEVGERLVEGSDIRRKVLALLCLLVSKPRFACTREEVIDSLWPDQDPPSALNSLNQTVYFLRRVFEPDFHDETSPGYVGQDGETIWLDTALVQSESRRCFDLIRNMPGDPSPEGSLALATEYSGRFALDFAYEEWAAAYRDTLHAAYLRVMERAVRIDLDTGHIGRGTFLAERAAEADPESEEIQAALVRLYRYSGAHSAAAEQYDHYARAMRDLGVEPLAFADV